MAGGGSHQRRRGYLGRNSALAFRRQMRARRCRLDHRDAEAVLQHHGAGQVTGQVVGNPTAKAPDLDARTPRACAVRRCRPPLKFPVSRRNGAVNLGKIATDSLGDTEPRMYLSQ
jgi:hypothetical protein